MDGKNATVYLDGFNLYHGIVDKGWSRYKWLDLCSFAEKLIPSGYALSRVWYFTSRIKGNVAKHSRQQKYISALMAQNGRNLTIKYGNYQIFDSHCKHCGTKPVVCDQCKAEYSKPNEKKTDVNLATHMLADCIEQITDCTVLVTGDSDYEAPLAEVKRLFPAIHRIVAYPPKRRNHFLDKLCDDCFDIDESHFAGSQLPDVVKARSGKTFCRPPEWS